eukprot:6203388-Pleurochrysis_carterae.AAC.1
MCKEPLERSALVDKACLRSFEACNANLDLRDTATYVCWNLQMRHAVFTFTSIAFSTLELLITHAFVTYWFFLDILIVLCDGFVSLRNAGTTGLVLINLLVQWKAT